MTPTIYLVPRWGGTIHSDWYDWFDDEIQQRHNLTVNRLDMPNWHQPNIDEAIDYLTSQIHTINSSTFFIGHSVGCQAILRFLALKMGNKESIKIGGLLFVAGWIRVVKSWPTLDPWLNNATLPYQQIVQQTNQRKLVISDNDPFTPDYLANEALWKEQLLCDVTLCHNRAHFNGSIQPEVLEAFEQMMGLNPNIPL